MGEIIARYEGEFLQGRGDAFFTLCRAIVGQQISVKAADAIWARLEAHVQPFEPEAMQEADHEALRGLGLSRQKVAYLNAIADHFMAHNIAHGYWSDMSDEEAIKDLTSIKGIGRWTAEMFLIFHLLRADVFPIDDIGLQKGILTHYSPDYSRADMKQLAADKWAPWRSVATWYLWRSLDPVPVEY